MEQNTEKTKNIFILGQPRTGKSTIAKRLLSYSDFSLLTMDEVRHAFYASGILDIYAKKIITEVKRDYSKAFFIFIKEYVKAFNHNNPNVILIIEGMEMTIQQVVDEFSDDIIITLGVITDRKEDFFKLIRSQEKEIEHSWTKELTNIELHEFVERIIKFSCDNKKDAERLGIPFFSCEGYRTADYEQSIINHILHSIFYRNIIKCSERMDLMEWYLLLDFTDDLFDNYKLIENTMKISFYQILKVDYYDLLRLNQLRLRVPIIYHVDDLRIFQKCYPKIGDLRNVAKDIVIDIYGNIEKLGEII